MVYYVLDIFGCQSSVMQSIVFHDDHVIRYTSDMYAHFLELKYELLVSSYPTSSRVRLRSTHSKFESERVVSVPGHSHSIFTLGLD